MNKTELTDHRDSDVEIEVPDVSPPEPQNYLQSDFNRVARNGHKYACQILSELTQLHDRPLPEEVKDKLQNAAGRFLKHSEMNAIEEICQGEDSILDHNNAKTAALPVYPIDIMVDGPARDLIRLLHEPKYREGKVLLKLLQEDYIEGAVSPEVIRLLSQNPNFLSKGLILTIIWSQMAFSFLLNGAIIKAHGRQS